MGLRMPFSMGFTLALLLVGCAGFSYKYYGIQGVSYDQGTLLGPEQRDDIPFNRCMPSTSNRNPCVIMFAQDFFAFKQDYNDTKLRLQACEER